MSFARFRQRPERQGLRKLRNLRNPHSEVPPLRDGCSTHEVTAEDVAARWRRVEALIDATPEDDHGAQWSVVDVCACCRAPAHVGALACPRCESYPSGFGSLDPADE